MKRYLVVFALIVLVFSSCNLTDKNDYNEVSSELIDPEHQPVLGKAGSGSSL